MRLVPYIRLNVTHTSFSFQEIPTVTPPQKAWSSRDLAAALFKKSGAVDWTLFSGPDSHAKYRPSQSQKRLAKTEAPRVDEDDDMMDVDDDAATPAGYALDRFEDYQPSHALDDLHRQIIDHFSVVLKELCARIRRENGGNSPLLPPSRRDPAYVTKPFASWTPADCLDFLKSKKRFVDSEPPLRLFLLRRSEDYGWRRGQDWPRQAWKNVLGALKDIGEKFEDSLHSAPIARGTQATCDANFQHADATYWAINVRWARRA